MGFKFLQNFSPKTFLFTRIPSERDFLYNKKLFLRTNSRELLICYFEILENVIFSEFLYIQDNVLGILRVP